MTGVGIAHRCELFDAYSAVYGENSKVAKEGKKAISAYSTILSLVRNSLSFVNSALISIPKPLTDGLKVAKLPLILTVPCTIRELAKNIFKVVDEESSLKKRCTNVLKGFVNIDKLGRAAITVCEAGKIVGLWGNKALGWIPGFSYVSLVASAVSTIFDTKALVKQAQLLHMMNKGEKEVRRAQTQEEKAQALLALMEKLQAKKISKVSSQLKLGKEAQLAQRVESLVNKIKSSSFELQDLQEGERLVKILKTRSIGTLSLSSWKLATSLTMLTGSIFSSFTPYPPVGLGCMAAGSVMSTISWGVETFLINSNPFDPASKCLASKIADGVKEKATQVGAIVKHGAQRVFSPCLPRFVSVQ